MARDSAPYLPSPLWSGRLIEWSIVALILLALGFAFEREIRSLQAQGERVYVTSTVASLRTALLLNQLTRELHPDDATLLVKNPFLLLQNVPANYAGQMPMRDIYGVTPGNWVFDPDCLCVGYRLLYPQWLEPRQEVGAIWFDIGKNKGHPSLTPQASYVWLGTPLK